MTKTATRTIDITPTWSGVLPMLLAAYESGTFQGRDAAEKELRRMAALADNRVEPAKALALTACGLAQASHLMHLKDQQLIDIAWDEHFNDEPCDKLLSLARQKIEGAKA